MTSLVIRDDITKDRQTTRHVTRGPRSGVAARARVCLARPPPVLGRLSQLKRHAHDARRRGAAGGAAEDGLQCGFEGAASSAAAGGGGEAAAGDELGFAATLGMAVGRLLCSGQAVGS